MVKNIMLVIVSCIALAGCDKAPQETQTVGNDFKVGKLFTIDGCTVYRFSDRGELVYFSDCRGTSRYTTHNGKTSTDHDVSNGGR